jgi:hypothetical protein
MPPPTIIFDTSAVNRLAKEGARSEPLLIALRHGFDVWVTAMSLDEMLSTTDVTEREVLVSRAQRLFASGRGVWPPHEITSRLVSVHARGPFAIRLAAG